MKVVVVASKGAALVASNLMLAVLPADGKMTDWLLLGFAESFSSTESLADATRFTALPAVYKTSHLGVHD